MDPHFPKSPIALIFFTIFIVLCSFTTVRSEQHQPDPTIIRLPSESKPADPCGGGSPRSPTTCPVNCFRPDPVCGVDGVTYWCGCPDAQCAGVKVAKLGFCEVGSGGSAPRAAQALLLVHIVWLIVLGVSVLFGLF